MSDAVFTLHRGTTPLLVSLPHVGTEIPDDAAAAAASPRALAVEDTDWHLDRLYAFAPRARRRACCVPRHSRYVDRPEPAAREHADVPRREQHRAVPDALLHRRAALPRRPRARRRPRSTRRRAAYWQPYHDALAAELARLQGRARPRDAVRRPQHPVRAALAVRRPAARPEPRHRRRRELRAGAARRARAPCSQRAARLHPRRRRPLQGRLHHAPLRPAAARRARGAARDVLALLHGRGAALRPATRRRDARCSRCCATCCRRRSTGRPMPEAAAALGAARLDARRRWRERRACCAPARDGRWAEVTPGVAAPPAGARACSPARCCRAWSNAHSHAFQRAFAGLAERRDAAHDDFWSWRDRMYRVALRITPGAAARRRGAALRRAAARRLHAGLRVPLPAARRRRQPLRRPAGDVVGARRRRRRRRHRPDAAAGAVRARRLRAAAAARRPAPLSRPRPRTSGMRAAAIARSGRPLRRRRRRDPFAARRARPSRSPSCAGWPRASPGRSTSTSPSRRRRSTTASPPPARGRSNGWRASACSMRAGSSCTPRTATPAEIDAVARERRRRRALPEHRGQPRRRPRRPARLAGRRRAADDRLRQPGHARLARGAALARVRPAPGAAPAQRRRRAGGRDAGQRRAPVRARARRQRRRRGRARAGASCRARAPTCWWSTGSDDALLGLPPSHTARRAGLLQPRADAGAT